MSKDQAIGAGILAASVVLIVVYLWWLFISPDEWRWWAIALPVLVMVLAVLGIAGWIGYTMATTPPPKPLEEIPELSETAEKKETGASEVKPPEEKKEGN